MNMDWPPLGRDVFGGGRGGIVGDSGGPPRVTDIVGLPGGCADQGMPRDGRTLGRMGGQTAGDGGDSGEMGSVCPEVASI